MEDNMDTLISGDKYHSLPVSFAEILKKRGTQQLLKNEHSVPCGDWKSINGDEKMVNGSSEFHENECPLDPPTFHALPNLPINFEDPKCVQCFLDKNSPIVKVLFHIRKPIACYQQCKLNPNCALTFSALLSIMYMNTSAALCTIAMLIYNLMPLLDVGLYVCRFIIDKTVEIVDTDDRYDFYMKTFIFVCQVALVSLLCVILSSIIILPILSLVTQIVMRAVHIIA